MKLETKIASLILCLALPLTTACKKTPIPAEDPQPAEIGFTAASQAVWVKSGETSTPSFPHDDFGVWGIARQEGLQTPYVLWGTNSLALVEESSTPGIYSPSSPAYWMKGYKYNFLAIAPFADAGLSSIGITTKEDQLTTIPPAENPVDYMTFTYDMSTKYTGIPATETTPAAAPDYTFDLLAAAAEQEVKTGGYNTAKELKFWHLFAQLSIKVIFENVTGTVEALSIEEVDTQASFTIKQNSGSSGNTGTLSIAMNELQSSETELHFNSSSPTDSEGRWTAHIVPQDITDHTINIKYSVVGTDDKVTYYNDSISLGSSSPTFYNSNGRYNWTIKINPKGGIGFNVVISDWNSTNVEDVPDIL